MIQKTHKLSGGPAARKSFAKFNRLISAFLSKIESLRIWEKILFF
mgnify:CR=1 FL=1